MSAPGRPLEVVPETGVLEVRSMPARVRTTSLAAWTGLTGVVLAGAVVAFAAAHTNELIPQSVRPMPAWLAGVLAHTGLHLSAGALISVFTIMFACYALAVRGASELSPRAVLVGIAALAALFLLAPVVLSTDVFSYQAYGRMGTIYGVNPYLHGPGTILLDPVYSFIGEKWVGTPTAYGPLFTGLSYALAHLDISASVVAYKSIAAISFLTTVGLVWNAARLRGLDPVRAVAIVGLNPLTVVWGLGGGHNDLLMLAALTAGIYVLLQRRPTAAGATIVAAAAVKLTAGVVLPFALARPEADRRRLLAGAGVATAVVALFGFALFGLGEFHLPDTLAHNQSLGDWQSIPGFISNEFRLGGIGHMVGILLGLTFAGVTGWLLFRVWQGRMDWISGAGWAAVAMLVTASSLLPWYVAWLTPLAALSPDRRLRRCTLAMTGLMLALNMLGWVPHGSTLLGV